MQNGFSASATSSCGIVLLGAVYRRFADQSCRLSDRLIETGSGELIGTHALIEGRHSAIGFYVLLFAELLASRLETRPATSGDSTTVRCGRLLCLLLCSLFLQLATDAQSPIHALRSWVKELFLMAASWRFEKSVLKISPAIDIRALRPLVTSRIFLRRLAQSVSDSRYSFLLDRRDATDHEQSRKVCACLFGPPVGIME